MIGYLRGRLRPGAAPSGQTQVAVVDVGGVGYEVHVPLSTWYDLEAKMHGEEDGAEVELRIHTHVRDDAIQLFGFASERERELFLRLIQVAGIGPKLAQTILSGMEPGDLVSALARADSKALTSIPGVGKKTAERMVLEMKDKVEDLAAGTESAGRPPPSADDDLVAALVNLGYKEKHAARAVAAVEDELGDQADDAEFPAKLKAALRRLSRA